MPRRTSAVMMVALTSAFALLAGCDSGSGVITETLESSSATTIVSTPATTPLPPSESAPPARSDPPSDSSTAATEPGLSEAEAADRAAVEAQWVKSWEVYMEIARTPAAEREALIETVAVDPTRANMLTDAGKFDEQGLQTYGSLGHRISWPQPISGASTAVIDDCQDASQSGSLKTETGDKVTVGVARDHYQGNLVKGADGVWRVQQVFYLKDEPC